MTKLIGGAPSLVLDFGYWSAPFHDVPPCGDAAAYQQSGNVQWLIVIDAIGHGPVAARIAQLIIVMFDETLQAHASACLSPADLMRKIHCQLVERHLDEQAALGLFSFNLPEAQLDVAMVGNLDGILTNPAESLRLYSQNGMVGGRMPSNVRETRYGLVDNSVLGVFSDGMHFNELSDVFMEHVYHSFCNRPLTVMSRALVDRFRRQHDDSSCALVRIQQLTDG